MASTFKGRIFEFFMRQLLEGCGFNQVPSDGLIVYDGSPGQMIHGLGQAHNADVLMSPPMQTPFYFPTNLLVECKCYNEPLGLPFVRNVLGLREDINNFDIITPDILNARRNFRGKTPKLFPFQRHIYQVALASVTGFTRPAIEFAQVHRIPLISFSEGELFAPLRNFLKFLDNIEYSDFNLDDTSPIDCLYTKEGRSFLEYIDDLKSRVKIGLLENGTILFLCQDKNYQEADRPNSDFKLYWEWEKNYWTLTNNYLTYNFELPKEMIAEWKDSSDGWKNEFDIRIGALQMKEKYFTKIYVFDTDEDCVRTLKIDKNFLNEAYAQIFNNSN